MSGWDTTARPATPGTPVFTPLDSGQLACLGSIDAGFIFQDKVVLRSGMTNTASLSFSLFDECDTADKLSAVLYASRPNVVLVGIMSEYDRLPDAMKRLATELLALGKFVAVLMEPVDDSMGQAASFLSTALALSSNVPFGCKRLQLADRALMHLRMHDQYKVQVISSTSES